MAGRDVDKAGEEEEAGCVVVARGVVVVVVVLSRGVVFLWLDVDPGRLAAEVGRGGEASVIAPGPREMPPPVPGREEDRDAFPP